MLSIFDELQILISGIICGLILFQSIFVAPTVFKELAEEHRPVILRSLFPKLFKSIAMLGLVFLLLAIESMSGFIVGLITTISGIVCLSLIGATNKAKDEGNNKKFSLLHRISVLLTMTVLVFNTFWIFLN